MLRCKHVAKALAQHRHWDLPWYSRLAMRVHVSLCVMCGRYHRHVMVMQEMAQQFAEKEEDELVSGELSDEARQRMVDALKAEKS